MSFCKNEKLSNGIWKNEAEFVILNTGKSAEVGIMAITFIFDPRNTD